MKDKSTQAPRPSHVRVTATVSLSLGKSSMMMINQSGCASGTATESRLSSRPRVSLHTGSAAPSAPSSRLTRSLSGQPPSLPLTDDQWTGSPQIAHRRRPYHSGLRVTVFKFAGPRASCQCQAAPPGPARFRVNLNGNSLSGSDLQRTAADES
eukprot:1060563-Rhodomonas_salina.1